MINANRVFTTAVSMRPQDRYRFEGLTNYVLGCAGDFNLIFVRWRQWIRRGEYGDGY